MFFSTVFWFFFVHINMEAIVGDLQWLYCTISLRTSLDFWSLWTSSAILSSILWNFLKGRFDQQLLTALSLFLFLEAKQINSRPADGYDDESYDDDHVDHFLNADQKRLGPTPGHYFSYLIVETTFSPERSTWRSDTTTAPPRLLKARRVERYDAILWNTNHWEPPCGG